MKNKTSFNVVIDTNVIVSAIISVDSESPTVKILNLLFDNKINIFYSDEILNEYKDVLHRDKFGFDATLVDKVIEAIKINGTHLLGATVDTVLSDIKDKPFYELVMNENIENGKLITGNIKHFPVQPNIITPRDFMTLYENSNNI